MNLHRLKKTLIRQEGESLKPYVDTEGHATIGVGHKIRSITHRRSRELLDDDVREAIKYAYSFDWFERLDNARQEVVVNMIFNMGLRRFKGFKKTIKALKRKDYLTASKEMLDSKWHYQVKRRARDLARVMRTGEAL